MNDNLSNEGVISHDATKFRNIYGGNISGIATEDSSTALHCAIPYCAALYCTAPY